MNLFKLPLPIARRVSMLIVIVLVAFTFISPAKISAAPNSGKPPTNVNSCAAAFGQLASPEGGLSPDRLISKYLHMPFGTPAGNANYIAIAKRSRPPTGSYAVHVEFSNLQDINTITNSKNLATSITNKHKELWFDAMEELERRYKGKVSIPSYSDFKSGRQILIPKPPATTLPKNFQKDLDTVFARVNAEFSDFIKKSGASIENKNGLNVDGNVDGWFRAGTGKTADLAEIAARMSRDMALPNVLRHADDPALIQAADVFRQWAEMMRGQIGQTPSFQPLMEGDFIKDKVLDMVKKTPDMSKIRARLRAKYGAELTENQILQLQTYNQVIDKFSLGPRIENRVIATLEKADLGGYSADASGLSAKNRGGSARAIASGKDLEEVVKLARTNEQEITRVFKEENVPFTQILNRYYKTGVSSGDDFAGDASKIATREMKQSLVTEVAELPNPSAWRIAFISDGVRVRDRNMMGAHGEAIEKVLREVLEDRIPTEKLDQMFFGVDMAGKTIGSGNVSLVMGEGAGAHLSKNDRAEIKAAFKQAIDIFNQKAESEPMVKQYVAR